MIFVRYAPILAIAGIASLLLGAASDVLPLLVNRVDEGKKTIGIIVGTVGPGGRELTPYGSTTKGMDDAISGDTIFEIGSITKVFTSLILADMVVHGEVRLDTPVADLLPPTINVPKRGGKQITLQDLAMHVSGLPGMPPGYKPADMANPFADLGLPQLYTFLNSYSLTRDIGSQYEYSNLGVGLLGRALARKAGLSYGDLLRKRVLDPLQMANTSITLSAEQRHRLAPGYDGALFPARNWDFDALAGAGALHSTANDLLKFLDANLEFTKTPLAPAMRLMRSVHHSTDSADMDILLGWHSYRRYGVNIVWHNGVTGGYWSFIGFDPDKKKGAVVLSNTRFDNDAIGLHSIDNRWPVEKLDAPRPRIETDVEPAVLSRYIGTYRFSPTYSIQISMENGHLWVRDTSDKALELVPENDTEFFFRTIDAQVSFVTDSSGKAAKLLLHVNGDDSVGLRIQ